MKLISIIALLSVISGVRAQSGVPLSLEECRALAIEGSQLYDISLRDVEIAEYSRREVVSDRLPSLDLAANAAYNLWDSAEANLELRDYNYDAALVLTQPIIGSGLASQSRKAKLELARSEYESSRVAEEVVYSATVAYYTVLSSLEKLKASEQYVAVVGGLYSTILVKYNEGAVARNELLMVEIRRNEAELQLLEASRAYRVSLRELNTALGNSSLVEYHPTDTMAIPRGLPNLQGIDYALSSRSDYLAKELASEASQEQIDVTRSGFNPKLYLEVSGNYGTPTLNLIGAENRNYGAARLRLSAPIFNFGARSKSVSKSKLDYEISQLELESAATTIASEVDVATIKLQQSFQEVEFSAESEKIAAENLSLSTFSYQEGSLPILDVLWAQLSWIEASISTIDSLYDYYTALALYDLSIGRSGF